MLIILIIGYPLFFQAGKFWHYVLKSGYPLFQAGKFWHYVLKSGYPLFQAGKVSISC